MCLWQWRHTPRARATRTCCKCMFLVSVSSSMVCSLRFISRMSAASGLSLTKSSTRFRVSLSPDDDGCWWWWLDDDDDGKDLFPEIRECGHKNTIVPSTISVKILQDYTSIELGEKHQLKRSALALWRHQRQVGQSIKMNCDGTLWRGCLSLIESKRQLPNNHAEQSHPATTTSIM